MKTLELGQGLVDLPAVIEAAGKAGVDWLIVEQDDCQNPPLQSIENNYDWVKTNFLHEVVEINMKEKLHDGRLYLPGDEQLMKEQTLCLERLYDFNGTRPLEYEKKG